MNFRQELLLMLEDAGFSHVQVEGFYTGTPASAGDTSVVFVAHAEARTDR